jgi:hypothetical protein
MKKYNKFFFIYYTYFKDIKNDLVPGLKTKIDYNLIFKNIDFFKYFFFINSFVCNIIGAKRFDFPIFSFYFIFIENKNTIITTVILSFL